MPLPRPPYSETPALLRLASTWKGNLLFFGSLILFVLIYFYWQVQQAQHTFLKQTQADATIIAEIIKRNAHRVVLSQETIATIIETFLGNTARFVAYLDQVEPFSADELASFAQEAGLAGIRIATADGRLTEGPPGWLPADAARGTGTLARCNPAGPRLQHLPQYHLYCLIQSGSDSDDCITVGIPAGRIEILQKEIGLPQLLNTLSQLGGIHYIRFAAQRPAVESDAKDIAAVQVQIVEQAGNKIAETRIVFDNRTLVIGLEARHLFARKNQLWREFFIFSAVLALLGLFFSWILHHFQSAHLKQVRGYERRLAQQHEDAALGRAAAAIAHEIRNPLNAISMGLQRLQLETPDLEPEHRQLITGMRQAVTRTDRIVNDIRRYARPLSPRRQPVNLGALIDELLALYLPPGTGSAIDLQRDVDLTDTVETVTIPGDPTLLTEALENILKNSIEAQPHGGVVKLALRRDGTRVALTVENKGFSLARENARQILDPYFTTKTRGTGLGLSITQRIVQAHGGSMTVTVPVEGTLRVGIYLPAT